METGPQLKAERLQAGARAKDVAVLLDCDPAEITRLEQREEVAPRRAQRYRRALDVLRSQRAAARRELIRELATR